MLINFSEDNGIYKAKCSCGDDIYLINKDMIDEKVRCLSCLKLNKQYKKQFKDKINDVNKELIRVVSKICNNSDLVKFCELKD